MKWGTYRHLTEVIWFLGKFLEVHHCTISFGMVDQYSSSSFLLKTDLCSRTSIRQNVWSNIKVFWGFFFPLIWNRNSFLHSFSTLAVHFAFQHEKLSLCTVFISYFEPYLWATSCSYILGCFYLPNKTLVQLYQHNLKFLSTIYKPNKHVLY